MTKTDQELKEDGLPKELFEDMSYAMNFLKDIMTDDAAQNIATSLSGILAIGRELSNEEVNFNLTSILKESNTIYDLLMQFKQLKEDGTWETMKGLIYGVRSFREMLNDEAIEKMGGYISMALESLPKIDQFLSMTFSEIPMNFMKSITSDEMKKMIKEKKNVTNKDLITLFNDPNTKKGLWIFLLAMREMGKSV